MAIKVVYDAELLRPGCALLQAALGGDAGVACLFPTDSWLLSPTDDLKLYEVTEEQLGKLVNMSTKVLEILKTMEDHG